MIAAGGLTTMAGEFFKACDNLWSIHADREGRKTAHEWPVLLPPWSGIVVESRGGFDLVERPADPMDVGRVLYSINQPPVRIFRTFDEANAAFARTKPPVTERT